MFEIFVNYNVIYVSLYTWSCYMNQYHPFTIYVELIKKRKGKKKGRETKSRCFLLKQNQKFDRQTFTPWLCQQPQIQLIYSYEERPHEVFGGCLLSYDLNLLFKCTK